MKLWWDAALWTVICRPVFTRDSTPHSLLVSSSIWTTTLSSHPTYSKSVSSSYSPSKTPPSLHRPLILLYRSSSWLNSEPRCCWTGSPRDPPSHISRKQSSLIFQNMHSAAPAIAFLASFCCTSLVINPLCQNSSMMQELFYLSFCHLILWCLKLPQK